MDGWGPLFSAPAQAHSDTSVAAADAIRPSATVIRSRVLRAIVAAGEAGATDEELQDGLVLSGSTQRPRRVELVAQGAVVDSGIRRKTRSGRQAVVWMAR